MLRSKYLIYFAFISSLFSKEIIAVLDLEQIGLSPQEATILTQRLTTKLISLNKYQVVERNNMDKILKEQKFQHSGCTDSECAVGIGQLLNSDYIIIGSVNKFSKTYTIDARLIDVGLGKAIIGAEFSMTGKIDELLIKGIPSIAKQLCGMQVTTTLIQTPTQPSTPTVTSVFGTFTISGTVKDAATGEPLPYTNIMVLNTDSGTASDINGYYIIPKITTGEFTIQFMMIGFATLSEKIKIYNENIRVDVELNPKVIDVNEITVSAERMRFEKKVDISRVNISNRDIRRAPAFVEADLFRTLQLLPSVSASNDFNAALIVRGGSPDENLILLDGTEIYNPYHIGGVFSTFNADMISDAEFLAGGFPAKFGGRLSSVLNITGREGDSKNGRLPQSLNGIKKYWDFSGASGNISLLSSKILTEGYLYRGSWMFSARRTYFDKFVDMYYNSKNENSPGNYYFWDTHLKLKFALNSTSQFFYSQFSGKDDLFLGIGGNGFPGIDFAWDWGNRTKNLTWKYIPLSNYLINSRISKTTYNFNVDFAVDFNADEEDTTAALNLDQGETTDLSFYLDNLVEDLDINQTMKYIINNKFSLDVGWQIKNLSLKYTETFAGQQVTNISSLPQTASTFFNINWNPSPLLGTISGFRISKFKGYDKLLINPKFSIKYNPVSDLAIKASMGRYSQFLYTINQEEELLRIVDFWQPIPEGEKPQEADHIIVGLEYWMSEGNSMSLETYYKSYSTIYDINPRVDVTDIESTLAIAGTARAGGIEFLYRFNKNKLSGWLSYAYSKIERTVDLNSDGIIWDGQEIYPAKYDKPHSFNTLISYRINDKYSIGLNTSFGSGQTYTPVIGKAYQTSGQSYGSLQNPYSNFGNIYGAKNSSKYPNYFRVDASIARKMKLFGIDSELKFQIINLTDYYNVLLYNWDHESSPSKVQAYSMFPRIITFGWEFKL